MDLTTYLDRDFYLAYEQGCLSPGHYQINSKYTVSLSGEERLNA